MASFTITPLTEHTGAEVVGLDFTQAIDTQTRATLNGTFAERHVLVMRDQHFTPEQFKAAAQRFGELQQHDKKERHVPGHPDVYYISNDEIVDGRRIIPGETFHTDHSNHPRPPKATMLFAVELPSSGGDTQYVNMHDAYDDLPEETKKRIDDLKAVHVYLSKYSPRPLGSISEESRRNVPPPGVHPLVRTHPENGRKALFLNPVRMESIVGMDDRDALALIDELMRKI
jgi:taurine dioxygenase